MDAEFKKNYDFSMQQLPKIWMRKTIKQLLSIIDQEVDEEVGVISNERLWSKGAKDEEEASMHLGNIETHQEYVKKLGELRNVISDFSK